MGRQAAVHSTATAGFTTQFLMTTCCAMGPKTQTPMETWDADCGTGPNDAEFGINWRHLTLIAPEYGTNTNHTGYLWTIDTTDPAKPFLLSKWKLPGSSILPDGTETSTSLHPRRAISTALTMEIQAPTGTFTGPITTQVTG